MLLAELEVFHSRPIAPTRRIALGRCLLPGPVPAHGPGPGYGGILLGAVCASFGPRLSDESMADAVKLSYELEQGRQIPQPRLRHRLQHDRIGLTRSRQRLYGPGSADADEPLACHFEASRATPNQLLLGAVYAAGLLPMPLRGEAMQAVRLGLVWRGEVGEPLFGYLCDRRSSGRPVRAVSDPVGWAMEILGLDRCVDPPEQAAVQRGFREALRSVHPDLGASNAEAAMRIAELSEARRILLTL